MKWIFSERLTAACTNHKSMKEMYLTLRINEEIPDRPLNPGVNNHFAKVHRII